MPAKRQTMRRAMWRQSLGNDKSGKVGPLRAADLIDPEDPAFRYILEAGMQLSSLGLDPSDPEVAQKAIDLGRIRYNETLSFEEDASA